MTRSETVLQINNYEELNKSETREKVLKSIEQVFSRLDPEFLLHEYIKDVLKKGGDYRSIYVIGFGKASLKMYKGLRQKISGSARYSGIIIPVGEEVEEDFPELEILKGNHPIPSGDTLESSNRMMSQIKDLKEDDLVLVLISGGGSALFEIPDNGFTIDDIGTMAKCLMNSGADIHELNAVRQAMSSVKGGRLAEMLYPAEVHGFIISDVPGDDPAVIASGPLTRPHDQKRHLKGSVEKFGKLCPKLKMERLLNIDNTVDPKMFQHVTTKLILKNRDFVNHISETLEMKGEEVIPLPDPITGDVEETAQWFADKMRKKYRTLEKPFWIVGGGETTSKVIGNGLGGRNCELSLRVALEMDENEEFLFASMGTDGIDGSSPAMGGITDNYLLKAVPKDEIREYLSNSDSFTLLEKYDSAVSTGYTGTNVSDIFIAYYNGRTTG